MPALSFRGDTCYPCALHVKGCIYLMQIYRTNCAKT